MIGEFRRVYRRWRKLRHQNRALLRVSPRACPRRDLRYARAEELDDTFRSPALHGEWAELECIFAATCSIEDGKTGGVNPGDRRALYYLVRGLKPRRVLEIGTHVGASTFHIAAALERNRHEDPADTGHLTTVDIEDVNNECTASWKRLGLSMSPAGMMATLGCEDRVRFVCDDSVSFLENSAERFDFIFLDGSHAARLVYQEIPLALSVLSDGGSILLHDYFPENRPLWSDGEVVPGPCLAVRRLRSEDAKIDVMPPGALPCPGPRNLVVR